MSPPTKAGRSIIAAHIAIKEHRELIKHAIEEIKDIIAII